LWPNYLLNFTFLRCFEFWNFTSTNTIYVAKENIILIGKLSRHTTIVTVLSTGSFQSFDKKFSLSFSAFPCTRFKIKNLKSFQWEFLDFFLTIFKITSNIEKCDNFLIAIFIAYAINNCIQILDSHTQTALCNHSFCFFVTQYCVLHRMYFFMKKSRISSFTWKL